MKKAIAALLACTVLCTGIPWPGQVQARAAEETSEAPKLTPADLTFRKVWTVRNMFNSKVPIADMDFSDIQSGEKGALSFQEDAQGLLQVYNSGEEEASDRVLLGDHTPYGAYDVEVTQQEVGTDVSLELVKDEDNKVVITQTNEGENSTPPEFLEEVSSLDMTDENLLEKTGVYDDNPPYNVVSKIEGGIRFEGGTGRGESFVPVASLEQGHIYSATIANQSSGYANIILKLRKDSKNGIFFVQRSSGDCTYEIFRDGTSVKSGAFKVVSTDKPSVMSIEIQGGDLVFSCSSAGKEEFSQTVTVSDVFDFTDPQVLEQFEFVIGGRIDPGEYVEFSAAGEYQKVSGETALDTGDVSALTKYDDVLWGNSGFTLSNPEQMLQFQREESDGSYLLDMTDQELLDKTGVYDDVAPYNQVTKTEKGIRFEGGTGRGESFVPVAPAMQNYGYEAEISEQTDGYANQIMKLRMDSKNAVFFVRKADGSVAYEVFKDGVSQTGSVPIGNASSLAKPYVMRMEIQGENLVLIQGDLKETVNVKEFFDLTDPQVLSQFEVVIGGRIDPGQAVEYDMAKAEPLSDSGTMESFVAVSPVRNGLVHQATVQAQTDANVVIAFRKDRENSIRLVAEPGGRLYCETYQAGLEGPQNVQEIAKEAVHGPYTLRMEIQEHQLKVTMLSLEGEVLVTGLYDVSGNFDLTDTAVTDEMEFVIGASSQKAGEVLYSAASVWYQKPEEEEDSHYGELKLEVYEEGRRTVNKVIASGEFSVPYTLRADFSAKANVSGITPGEGNGLVNIWRVEDGKATMPAGNSDIDFSLGIDFSRPDVIEQYQAYLGVCAGASKSATVSQVSHYLTGGAAQADPKPLHNEKGEILQEDGKIWIAMTTRGYSINSSYQGIYELDLKTQELTLVGSMAFNLCQDGERRYGGYHASDIIYNEQEDQWIVLTTSHINNHQVNSGVLEQDPRTTAFQFVDVKKVDYPGSVNNEEDASLIYDEEAGKWRLVLCMQGAGGYQLPLFEADSWDGTYQEVGRSTEVPCTGIQLQKIDGEFYIFFGRGTNNCEALYYPEMTKAATLNIQSSPRSYNVWPVILPLTDEETGVTRYFMLSFDRDGHTNQHSYGNLYLYEAEEYSGMPAEKEDEPVSDGEPIVDGKITSVEQLLQIRNDLSGDYTLEADLDLSGVEDFVPIGDEEEPFTGTFDGNGHVISNLSISREEDVDVGLFGCIGEEGSVKNLTLREAKVKGRIYTGILAGYNKGTIESCIVSGSVETYAAGGGLAGQNTGVICESHSMGEVRADQGDGVGGLVGVNSANIGEIALDRKGIIRQCSSESQVNGNTNAGGLVGFNDCGTIENSYATGDVSGVSYVGGLVGNIGLNYGNSSKAPVTCCYATGDVSGEYGAGGFAGYSDGTLTQCFATGTVSARRAAGGLLGIQNNDGKTENGYAIGAVDAGQNMGLLIGENYGSFENSAASSQSGILGNSPYSLADETAPSFTSASSYEEEGKLNGYAKELWSITEGSLPVLKDAGIEEEREILKARAWAEELYESCMQKEEEDYTAQSWSIFKDKLEYFKTVLEDAGSSAERIIQAGELLQEAEEMLAPKQADTKVLDEALKAAEKLEKEKYTQESYAKVEEAVKAAENIDVYDKEAVDQAALDIWNAIAQLELDMSGIQEDLEQAKDEAEAAKEQARLEKEQAELERLKAEAAEKAKEAAEKAQKEAEEKLKQAQSQQQDHVGTVFQKGSFQYRITKKAGTGTGTVTLTKARKKSLTKASIPSTVKFSGKSYQVTAMKEKAFQNCKKLRKVVIGKNVKTVGKSAFENCRKLERIVIKSTSLKKIGKKAFRGISEKAKVQVPKKKRKAYTKMLRQAGLSKKVKI